MLSLCLIIVLSYLAGSIPTSIIVSKVLRGIDIRDYGSGNPGATNVYRVLGCKPALFVILVDAGKGVLATIVISKIAIDHPLMGYSLTQIVAGVSVILGHVWTIFAGFKGGKGVGTALGAMLGIAPSAALLCLAIWLIIVFTTRIVSVGSLTAAVLFPIIIFSQKAVLKSDISLPLQIFSLAVALLVIITHRSNIKRLIQGREYRFKRVKER